MKLNSGQYVVCLLRNNSVAGGVNMVVEGVVDSWSDDESVIKSTTDESSTIILHTLQDVLLVKIKPVEKTSITTESKHTAVVKPAKTLPIPVLEKELEEVYNLPSNDDLRLKKMAELKILLSQQERNIITHKLKEHHISSATPVKYGYPSLLKK